MFLMGKEKILRIALQGVEAHRVGTISGLQEWAEKYSGSEDERDFASYVLRSIEQMNSGGANQRVFCFGRDLAEKLAEEYAKPATPVSA